QRDRGATKLLQRVKKRIGHHSLHRTLYTQYTDDDRNLTARITSGMTRWPWFACAQLEVWPWPAYAAALTMSAAVAQVLRPCLAGDWPRLRLWPVLASMR